MLIMLICNKQPTDLTVSSQELVQLVVASIPPFVWEETGRVGGSREEYAPKLNLYGFFPD